MRYIERAKELVLQMTLEEKASLCSGKDFWHMKGIERLGLEEIMLADGPHGLRKQEGGSDHLGINKSVPATCFPTASATACSFDIELMKDIGVALGEECLQNAVSVILGPGVNIKRSPLCGRNFEYISEDPYLTGKLASALVNGVQSQGVGTSVKHYAVNNQETRRMTSNSVVDMRALREIYLSAYETIVKESQPWTFMCSYNLINGTYAAEHKWLLSDILRDEWGFEGIVVTDWGAIVDRVTGIESGLDLEMPACGGYSNGKIVEAVNSGSLDVKELDKVTERLVELILKAMATRKSDFKYDGNSHHMLAREASAKSSVLLKNEDAVLPISTDKKVAVIGGFAKKARYQGAGSSKINPSKIDNVLEELTTAGYDVQFAEGYSLVPMSAPDDVLIEEACNIAKESDVAIVFAGLPDEYESEGFDRKSLDMPEGHNKLIEAVSKVNSNTVVVLMLGAPVVLPWSENVKGILVAYLGGQAVGSGIVDILSGNKCPSGKLAETWPVKLSDTSSFNYFPGRKKSVEYRESIFVGYRYYDTVGKEVAYPFGYGLSYTKFEYSNLKAVAKGGTEFDVSFTITNVGDCSGAEIAQLYLGKKDSETYRANKELRGFEKVQLDVGESKNIIISLDENSFKIFDVKENMWVVENGVYEIQVGSSSRDIVLNCNIEVEGIRIDVSDLQEKASIYWNLPKDNLEIDDASFIAVYGKELPPSERLPDEKYSINSTMTDIQDCEIGKNIYNQVKEGAKAMMGDGNNGLAQIIEAMLADLPLRGLSMLTGEAFPPQKIEEIVCLLNSNN